MNLYVIRRPSGWRTPEDLQAAAARSKQVGDEEMSSDIRWIRSYVVARGRRRPRHRLHLPGLQPREDPRARRARRHAGDGHRRGRRHGRRPPGSGRGHGLSRVDQGERLPAAGRLGSRGARVDGRCLEVRIEGPAPGVPSGQCGTRTLDLLRVKQAL